MQRYYYNWFYFIHNNHDRAWNILVGLDATDKRYYIAFASLIVYFIRNTLHTKSGFIQQPLFVQQSKNNACRYCNLRM